MPGTNEQSQQRGEDGRFVSPTSQSDASAAAAPVAPDAASTSTAGEHAPVTAAPAENTFDGKTDPYEAAVKTVNAKYADDSSTVVAADQTATPAKPAPTPSGQNTRDAKPTPSPSPTSAAPADAPAAADPVKDYGDTLSKKEYDLLKSEPGYLFSASDWKTMSQTERFEHLQGVREIRADRARRFQQQNDPRQGAQQTVSEPGPQTQPRGARDAGVTQTPATSPVQLPQDVEAALADVAQEFGADSSVYRAQRTMAERAERQIQSQQSERQQMATQAAAERQTRLLEDGVFAQIQDKYPPLKDPQTRDQLRQSARDIFDIRQRRGQPVTPQEAIQIATHNALFPQIQSAQQQQAEANKKRSLAGTFDAGPPAPTKPANTIPKNEDDRYADAAEKLNNAYKSGVPAGEKARAFATSAG